MSINFATDNYFEKSLRVKEAEEKQRALYKAPLSQQEDYNNSSELFTKETEIDFNNSLQSLAKRRSEAVEMYGQFYSNGVSYDVDGNPIYNQNAYDYADRLEFAELLHSLYPEYSVEYFVKNAESFMERATGVKHDISTWRNHIANTWNAAWASAASSLSDIGAFLSAGMTGAFGTEEWQEKKKELNFKKQKSGAGYRKDLADKKYSDIASLMISGTVSQAPQMASVLLLSALTGGTAGIAGTLASKGMITLSSAQTAVAVANGLGKAANFLVSGAMDAGNFMSELSDLGYSDEAALTGGLAILLSTGYLETLGDDQILKPVNKFADALVKNGNEGIVHDAVDGVLDYLKKAGWQAIKHVGASEITETVQEEVEYVNELFAKYLVDTYEKKHGNGKSLEELGLTKQQVVDGLIETAKQTALSTPLMTLGSSALSIGLDVAVGGASDSWKVPTYMNKEGATSTISTKNIIKDNLHVDKNLKGENDNSKANPISAHRVGNYIFVDGDISPEQENVIKTKKAVFIKDNLDSKVIKEDYKQLNSNSTDVKLKMTSAQADKVLASMETSNALSSYAYSDGKVVTGQYDNNTKELFINTNNQEQTLKIEINENTSLDDYINSVMGLSLITGTNLSQNLNSINTEASEEYENSREKRKKKESNENKTSEIKENETQETPEIKQDEAVSPQEEENEDSFFQDVNADSQNSPIEKETENEESIDSDFDAWAGTKKENENLIDKEELVEEKRTVKDKAVSYDDFEYSKKKGKVVYETHEFVNEDGNAVTEKEKPYAIKLTKEDGTSDYVNISKLGNVKKNRIISLAKDSKVNIQENENNAVNEKAQNTETAKELVGITNVPVEISTAGEQKTASNTQNTQENNTNTVNETIENNTATTEQVQATTEETAQPTANEEATVEPEKNVKEDLTNIDFNKEVNKVIKETESTPVEAQDTVLVAKGIQDAAEQLGEDIPISDIVSKFTEKDVANLKNGKYLNNISSKVTKVIANTEFGKKLFRLMFGNDIEVNSTTTSQFKELFTSFLKGEKIEASEDVFNALTRLKDGILATYINNNTAFEGDTKVEAEVLNENKPINAEEVIPTQKTETEQAEESLKKEEPKTETQKVKISADALNKEWWSKNNRADNDYSEYHAFIMAHYAAEYYNDQYRMQKENNPEIAEYFKQLRNIYRDYRNGIYAGDINDAYDFLATNYALEAIALNGKEYKNSSGKEKTIKLEKEKTRLNRTTAIMSETVMKEYYSTRENRTPDEIGNQTISDKQLSKLQILFNDKYEQELDNIANDIVNSLVNEYEYLELKDIVPRLEAFLENRATIGELLGYMTKFNDALNEINPYTKDAIKEYRDNKTINMAIGKLIEASVKQELAKRYDNLKTKTRSEILEKVLYGYRNDKYKHLLDSKYDNSALNVIKTEVKQNEIIRYESSLKGHNEQSKEVGIYASSFEYDPKTKKYHFNADNLVNEIYQVFIANNNSEEDSIKAATVSSAFLSSYSEDVQDAIIRRSIDSNNKTKLLSGGNENLLRLFFANNEYIDKEGKSGLPDEVSGASLVNSAKIILSSQSDEQTVRHESTHLVWHTNEDFRNRAREEYGRLMSTDKGRLELTAVIDRNQERFATDVDETIRAFEYLISDKFDYQSEEARNAEEAIVAMSNIWWDGDDNVKNWSEGIKGVFEHLANIIKTAFEHLKQFFNTDLVVDANDRVFAPLFENKEELHKFYDDIRNSSVDTETRLQDYYDNHLKHYSDVKVLGVDKYGNTFIDNQGSLVMAHAISAENLLSISELGGFPMPSLAIATPDNVPGFGDIILVANKDKAQEFMEKHYVYDRDFWSAVFPNVEGAYKLKTEYVINKVLNPLENIVNYNNDLNSEQKKFYTEKIESIKNKISKNETIIAKTNLPIETLREIGIEYSDILQILSARLSTFFETLLNEEFEFIQDNYPDFTSDNYPDFEKLMELEKELIRYDEEDIYLDSIDARNIYDEIISLVQKLQKKTEAPGLLRGINNFKYLHHEFKIVREYDYILDILQLTSWEEEKNYEIINVFEKNKKEVNAENALELMKEGPFSFARSDLPAYPNRVNNIEEAHNFEKDIYKIIDNKQLKLKFHDLARKLPFSITKKIHNWLKKDSNHDLVTYYKNNFGSLYDYLYEKYGKEAALNADKYITAIINYKTSYMEAKPQEIMQLSDFAAAIVPEYVYQDVYDLLKDSGLDVIAYDDSTDEYAYKEPLEIYAKSTFGASERVMFEKVSQSAKKANDKKTAVNYEQQQQFEELNYQFITNKYNSVISSWRKSLSDTFVSESDIKQLSEALNAKEAFFYINSQNLTDATKSLIANDVARRIAYSTEDYITYANKLGAIKEKLKNDDGSFKGINSEEAKEALFALFGYRKTTTETDEGTEASIKPVGVLAKVFSNDARSSWGVWGNDDARGFNAIYNSFKKSLSLEQDNNITNETIANLLDKSRWKQSNTQSNNNTLLNSSTKYNKLNFKLKGLDLTTEDLYNFMSLMVNDKNPVAWVENDTTYGGVLHGPLIDLLNYAHLDSDALGSGFTLNTISSTNDMYIKSAYNSFRHSGISLAEGTFDSSFFLLDSVTSNLLKAIEKLNNKKLLGSLYGSNVTKDYYDNLQKSIQDIIDTNIENLDKLKDIKNSLQEDISLDDMFKIVNDINSALSQNITVSHVTNNAEINILKNNINNLQNSVESWKTKVEKLKLENKEKISEIKNNISSIKTERNVLENKLNKEIARNEELQNSINERVNTILNDILNLKSKKLTDEDTKKFAELYNSNISLLNEEISSLKKQNEKLQKSIDTSITKVDEQNKGAELTLKDMTDLGISELFANTVKEIRNTARNTAKADISKKLTALVDAIYSPIQKGKIRVVDVNKLFDYRSIYTANKSENYLDYLANVDELRTFVINKMLSRGTTKDKGVVTRTISDLTAGELAELSKLVQQVSSDSRKFFMDSVKKENEYHSNWRKAISREIVDFAKLRGKNINLLEVEDSIGSDDSGKKTKGITDIIREFELVSVKYRDRFPTLYSYLFGGVDMNGNYYGGLNEASNNVYRSYKERFDIFKNEFINDISGTTFHKGKITEKNLQYEMNEAKNGYKTKLQESTLSINNIGKYGIKVEEYTQEGKKKYRVVEDEKVKSPMKEVARYIANKYVESKNIELKNDRYNELYNKKLDEITKRTNAIEKAQKSLEEVRSSDKYADDVKNQLIDMYNKKIDTNQKEINHAKAIISGYSEKMAKNMTELSALNNTGERPNENLADYTAQQLVGIYLIARQKGGIDKLTFNPIDSNVNSSLSNNLSIGNIIWVMENFENNKEFAPLKKLADTMANMLGEKFEQIKDVKFRLSNGTVLLDPVDYYFTFITEESNPYTYGEDIDIDLFDKIAESGLTVDATKAKASDTMTKERHGGSKALNLNAVDNFVSSIYKQEYYINMAEKIDNLKKLVNDKDFQTAFRTYYGRNDGNKNIKQMSEYINRLGNNATDDNSILGKFTRFFTNTKAQSAMAFSLTTVAMQIPTMLWCLDNKYIGVSGVLKAMARAFTDKTLYKYSPQMQERANSAINSIRKSKNLGTLLGPQFEKAVHKIQNAGMWMLEETDKYIANAMWYAYFEGVRKEFNEKGIGTNLSEQKFLDLCANEATQRVMDISPVMNPKDNALIYSSKSAFVRSMLLFTNQTNKMLNGIVKSFRDKDIVKKRIARTLAVSGIMMLLTGLINGKMTKKPDDDDEPKALTILKNSASSIAEGFVDLIPYDIIGSDSVVNYNLYTATKNLFKVMAKDEEERTEHQLGNAWARMISEIAGTAGLPGNATMKVWRTVRDENPLYLLNSTWANNFKGEE